MFQGDLYASTSRVSICRQMTKRNSFRYSVRMCLACGNLEKCVNWPCSPAGGSQRRDKRGSGVLLGPSLVGCALSLDLFLINEPLNTYCNLLYCTFGQDLSPISTMLRNSITGGDS